MWVVFDSITYEPKLQSKKGTTYAGWVMKGTKKGFGDDPDQPYEKVFFDSSATTIIEKDIARPNLSVVQFLQKACKSGDTIVMRNERDGKNWRIISMENVSGKCPTYEPLSDEEAASLRAKGFGGGMEAPAPRPSEAEDSEDLPWVN